MYTWHANAVDSRGGGGDGGGGNNLLTKREFLTRT